MILELTDELRDALPEGAIPSNGSYKGGGEVHRHVKNRLTYEVHLGELTFLRQTPPRLWLGRSAQGVVSFAQARGQRPH